MALLQTVKLYELRFIVTYETFKPSTKIRNSSFIQT